MVLNFGMRKILFCLPTLFDQWIAGPGLVNFTKILIISNGMKKITHRKRDNVKLKMRIVIIGQIWMKLINPIMT